MIQVQLEKPFNINEDDRYEQVGKGEDERLVELESIPTKITDMISVSSIYPRILSKIRQDLTVIEESYKAASTSRRKPPATFSGGFLEDWENAYHEKRKRDQAKGESLANKWEKKTENDDHCGK